MRISDWSSDVCSSDLTLCGPPGTSDAGTRFQRMARAPGPSPRANPRSATGFRNRVCGRARNAQRSPLRPRNNVPGQTVRARASETASSRPGSRRRKRSEEHTSELQSQMRIPDAVFCLKKKNKKDTNKTKHQQKSKVNKHV